MRLSGELVLDSIRENLKTGSLYLATDKTQNVICGPSLVRAYVSVLHRPVWYLPLASTRLALPTMHIRQERCWQIPSRWRCQRKTHFVCESLPASQARCTR